MSVRIYVCFDDTDNLGADRGTGKLVRWFGDELPDGCTLWGVVRQQLLVHPDIPYTSHNSSACAVVVAPDEGVVPELIERGAAHIARHWIDGSDPGLCVVPETHPAITQLRGFGRRAAMEVVSQAMAIEAVGDAYLGGHGGTNDGIIGAAAGVGLTSWGWCGRFVEYGGLRDYATETSVADLHAAGMYVLPVDRNVVSPKPSDIVNTANWLRPRLWGGVPAVPVTLAEPGVWLAIGKTSQKSSV